MFTRKMVLAGMFAVAFAAIALFPATASADNSDCLTCHKSVMGAKAAQNFDVAAVDYSTACPSCHLNFAGSHPYHNTTSNCSTICHKGWGAALAANVPMYTSALGNGKTGGFASPDSVATDPALLHIIHSKPRWMQDKSFASSSCKSCHAVAACDACHAGAPDPTTHDAHASTLVPAPSSVTTVSRGVINGNQADTGGHFPDEITTCSATVCHDTSGVAGGAPSFKDDKVHLAIPAADYLANPTVVKSAGWIVMKASAYTMGQTSSSNIKDATLSVPFTGTQVALVADKDPYRGIAEILIDNVSVDFVDMYSDTTVNQVEVWRSDKLASADHTITVKVTGTKRLVPVPARGSFVRVDQFKIYTKAPGSVAPRCTTAGCHPGFDTGHGAAHSLNTTDSAYNNTTIAGCTNAGAGCHGVAPSSYQVAHPASGCLAGPCHNTATALNHNDPAFNDPNTCQNCHGGGTVDYNNAPLVSVLTTTTGANQGHYNETTHTASSAGSVTSGGSASATCASCHNPLSTGLDGLYAQHQDTASGDLTCADCHSANAAVSAVIKTAKWSTTTCAECHSTGTLTGFEQHGAPAAGANATSTLGCGATGAKCHATYDVHALHKDAAGCALIGCHDYNKQGTKPALASMKCGSGDAACHADKSLANHPDHTYTATSNYAQVTSETVGSESGCSSSGDGCHGTVNTGNAVSDFHPQGNIDCLTSACHTSTTMVPAWKSGGSGAECSRCHAANFVGAPDATPLYQAASAGHYGETTHTATGMTTAIGAGGLTTAACSVCHSTTYRDAHGAAAGGFSSTTKGAYLTCTECHGYNAAVSAVTTDTVRSDTCAACHANGVLGASHAVHGNAPVAPATSSTGCASSGIGCHNTGDLHVIHKDASAGCTLTGCHAANKDMTSASTSCGQSSGCHLGANYTPLMHNGLGGIANGVDSVHHTAGAGQMGDTYTLNLKTTACSACHNAALGTEHGRATSGLSGSGANTCLKCHNDSVTVANVIAGDWANKNTISACSDCHANNDTTSAASLHGGIAVGAHTATAVASCTGLGAGCHGTTTTPDLSLVHTTGCALTRACHSTTVYNPGVKACNNASCHPTANYTAAYAHNAVNGTTDATHTATGMGTTLKYGTGSATATCATCHSSALKPAHNPAAGFATASLGTTWTADGECRGCHNATSPVNVASLVAANTWARGACTGSSCHNITQAAHVDGGTDPIAVTAVSSTGCASSGAGCHTTSDLHGLHKSASSCALTGCHNAANLDKSPTSKTCGQASGCHTSPTYSATNHGTITGSETPTHTAGSMTATEGVFLAGNYNDSRTCSTCHSSALGTEHASTSVGAVGCTTGGTGGTGCHNQASPVNATNVIKNTNWQATKLCTDCHGGSNGPAKHDKVATGHVGVHTGYTCSSASCHGTTDLRVLHAKKTASYVGSVGCSNAADANSPFACHSVQGTVPTMKTCGSGNGGCHTDKLDTGHGYPPEKHTATDANSVECLGCHTSTDLYALHKNSCSVCHSNSKYSAYNGGDLGRDATYGRTFPTNGCLACHKTPVMAYDYAGHTSASGHYSSGLTTHTAAPAQMSVNLTGTVLSEKGASWTSPVGGVAINYACSSCHVNTLMNEHAMTGATFANVPTAPRITDNCTGCHNSANFATNRDLWTAAKYCNTCHKASGGSAPAAHGSMAAKHNATTRPAAQRCGGGTFGTDCHDISDVSKIHTKDTTGDGNIESISCVGACHKGSAQGSRPTEGTGLDCGNAGCHDGAGTAWWNDVDGATTNTALTEHGLHHDTQSVNRRDGNLQTGAALSATESTLQCQGCHEINRLDRDHYALTGAPYGTSPWSGQTANYPTSFNGKACAPCHRKTTNTTTPSTVPSATVKTAIARDDMKCPTCHTGTSWNATNWKMHEDRGTGQTAANTEFNNAYSGHRSFTFMRGVIPTMTVPAQTTYSITMPTVNVFRAGVTLQPGSRTLSTTSMTYCDDCHDYTGATGPHGAAMTIGIETGYNMTNTTYLTSTNALGMSSTTYLCSKCHDLYGTTSGANNWGNNVHGDGNHNGNTSIGRCGQCHVRVAHAWKRPRLLVRHVSSGAGVDVAPYADSSFTTSGMNGFDQLNYTTMLNGANTSWAKSECQAGCSTSAHPRDGTIWP